MPQQIISQFQRLYNSPIEINRQVANITARDAISTSVRWEGMIVYVVSEGISYSLVGGVDNGSWAELMGISEAPEDGSYYVRKDGNWELLPGGIVPESGTFSPVLTDLGGGATYSVGSISANYIKIDKLVFFTMTLASISTSGTPTGALVIADLPYSAQSGTANTSFSVSWFRLSDITDSNLNKLGAYIGQGTKTLNFTNKVGAITVITFTSPGAIQVSGSYITD